MPRRKLVPPQDCYWDDIHSQGGQGGGRVHHWRPSVPLVIVRRAGRGFQDL